jgi:dihydrofolate reductase
MRKIILFIASSLDGFIADKDGKVDWLFTNGDYGYQKFFDSVDTLLMGKRTYDQVLGFGEWPWHGKKCYVFTRKRRPKSDSNVTFVDNPVHFTKGLLNESGKDIWLIGGSQISSLLLNAGLIHEIIISIHPVILGNGIPLFENIDKLKRLKLTKSQPFKSGLIQLSYKISTK